MPPWVTFPVKDQTGVRVPERIEGLEIDDFEIFEDGTPQAILSFTADPRPLVVGLLIVAAAAVTVLEDAACGDVLTLTYDAWAANAAPIRLGITLMILDNNCVVGMVMAAMSSSIWINNSVSLIA